MTVVPYTLFKQKALEIIRNILQSLSREMYHGQSQRACEHTMANNYVKYGKRQKINCVPLCFKF